VRADVLIVAGGANFPEKKPWEGGEKIWHDTVFALENPGDEWRVIGRLPHPLGYGVTVSHGRDLVCVGGSDSSRHHDSTFFLGWRNGGLEIKPLPNLPEARANLAAAQNGTLDAQVKGSASAVTAAASRLEH